MRRFQGLLLALLLSPLYAAYGAVVIVRAIVRLYRFCGRARVSLAREVHCQNGHPNATTGRWECASCRAQYHGWVGRCRVCGAGASWFPCSTCQVGIPLPWERT
ncbi:MAG: hypothetical protein HY898_27925 [Deltaproteobacteria bacterium]|nr:hypothetical protein [Deltaproteobacteria bacterium]